MRLWFACGALAASVLAAPPDGARAQHKAAPPGTPAPIASPADARAKRVVAEVFGTRVTAGELLWSPGTPAAQPAQRLRSLALRETLERFIRDNQLEATAADIAAYRDWDRRFRRVERDRRERELVRLETELKKPALPEQARARIEAGRDALLKLRQLDAEREALARGSGGAGDERALRVWIEGHKARKAMYEQYGGRVGITKFGPDPVGASEALLREHERAGRLRIDDEALAQAFWEAFIREPRQAARPEQIDFTYYWLKPVSGETQ
jgi:hypothetical protein